MNWLGGCKLGGFGLVTYYHLPWIHVFAGKEEGGQLQCLLLFHAARTMQAGIKSGGWNLSWNRQVSDFASSLPVDQAIDDFAGRRQRPLRIAEL